MPHDNDNVLSLNRVEGFADHRALAHLKILAKHVAVEVDIFEHNYPAAAPTIASLTARQHLPGVEQLKVDIRRLADFFSDFDAIVNNTSNGASK